ncbi:MAG TPA: hypothetical protein ENI79_05535, partial [Rhodospirillales bacterium]|nr:hypothetical protein [Rhodospirillales bacterium]
MVQPAAAVFIDSLKTALAKTGMVVLGCFHPRAGDPLPAKARTAVLVGNAGPAMWEAFAAGRRDEPEPLDAWSRRKLEKAAASLETTVFFPFGGPPHLPFQTWGLRAGGVFQSPIGLLIHHRYGLWFAYRGALALKAEWDIAGMQADTASPCRTCAGKPCLETCPVGAFKPSGYDVAACLGHLGTPPGADCRNLGCRA